jgi:hypothetical protein
MRRPLGALKSRIRNLNGFIRTLFQPDVYKLEHEHITPSANNRGRRGVSTAYHRPAISQ